MAKKRSVIVRSSPDINRSVIPLLPVWVGSVEFGTIPGPWGRTYPEVLAFYRGDRYFPAHLAEPSGVNPPATGAPVAPGPGVVDGIRTPRRHGSVRSCEPSAGLGWAAVGADASAGSARGRVRMICTEATTSTTRVTTRSLRPTSSKKA